MMEIRLSGHFSSGQALINWNPSLVRVEDQLNNLCFLKHFFFSSVTLTVHGTQAVSRENNHPATHLQPHRMP